MATGAGDWDAADTDAEGAATGEGTDSASDAADAADAATTPSAGADTQRATGADGGRAQQPQTGSSTPQSLVKQTAQRHQAHS